MAEVHVRELRGWEEMERVVDLQREVWGRAESDLVPRGLLVAVQDEGGLVAGAFVGGRMVGFVFGFPTRDPALHHSHMLGVLEAYRGTGAALLLKRFQRDWCLARGIRKVVWTFDPMRGANANFNLRKLGATARTYLPDLYGPMTGINAGAPSDRLLAEWDLLSERVYARLYAPPPEPQVAGLPQVNRVEEEVPVEERLGLEAPRLLFQIPEDWGRILREDPALALKWREHSRLVLSHYFARGYVAVDFLRHPNRYVLAKD
ncbi:chorismate synthase [Thermus composti]|uniref:GNAT family N-acetyltransferase n=1 Tax=Thermus composti TaxID=532059 RepID=A0ABV6PZ00_9DEIN|nr:GNAT family N-acetyltransferase [Thermus composti]GGM93831.1 chorismate synthase [Thermus composti]